MNKQPMPAQGVFTLVRLLLKRPRRFRTGPGVALQSEFELDRIDELQIARYVAHFGTDAPGIPVTFHYLLAQRAQLATMLLDEFPFRIAGMVHVENGLIEYRALDHAAPIQLSTTVRIEPPTQSGARFCVFETIGRQGLAPVFSCTSKYLAERGNGGGAGKKSNPGGAADLLVAQWQITQSDGRRYASVSGDWNPIHLTRWTAKLMGMRSPIIHGMCILAKATTQIQAWAGRRVRKIDGQFKSAVPLGDRVELRLDPVENTFAVWCKGRIAVSGSFECEVAQYVDT